MWKIQPGGIAVMVALGIASALNAWGEDVGASAGLVVSGNFDLNYGYNFNRPLPAAPNLGAETSGGTRPQYLSASENGSFRNFDLYHNQFTLNLAEISMSKKGKEVGFKADIDFGEIPDVIHNTAGAAASGSLDEVIRHVGQAVVSYNPAGAPKLTVVAGKMYTLMGWETTKAKDNWQYSRSILYAVAIPYWHLGAGLNYAWIPGKLSTSLHVYNGWNNLTDNNTGKTMGLQVSATPNESLAINYNLITGAEGVGNADYRTVHDLNVSYKTSPLIAFAMDAIYGSSNLSDGVKWYAVELAGKASLSPHFYLSPRIEGYWDIEGFTTGTPQELTVVTLTNGIPVSEGLEARIEGRWDHSSDAVFGLKSAQGASQDQVTAVLGLLYSL